MTNSMDVDYGLDRRMHTLDVAVDDLPVSPDARASALAVASSLSLAGLQDVVGAPILFADHALRRSW